LGGDGLDVFWLDDDHVGFYLLDVSGHGVAAALLAVTLARLLSPSVNQSSFLRAPETDGEGHRIVPPAEVARQLNQWLLANPAGAQFFTMLYGVLNVRTHLLRYVSAGHPPVFHAAADSEPALLRVPGYPVGCLEHADFEETRLQLRPGDRLVLWSDGLMEAISPAGEYFGTARLQRAIEAANGEAPEDCIEQVVGEVLQWAEGEPQDDLSVLALAIE
jgi:sigma-B regulation protein RsbU (phosphoserine phosphatase)